MTTTLQKTQRQHMGRQHTRFARRGHALSASWVSGEHSVGDPVGLWQLSDGTGFSPLAEGTVRTDAEQFRIGRLQPYTP